MNTYTELQRMPGRWLVLATILMISLAVTFNIWAVPGPGFPVNVLWLTTGWTVYTLIGLLCVYNIAFCQIDLRIDDEGIHYQLFPLNKGKTLLWSDVARVSVREFVLYGEYPQGRGMFRQGPNGWAHSFSRGIQDNYGLQIEKKSGVNILIGTQRPDELRTFLSALSVIPHPHHS
jgi:hypothetical protein